MRFFEILCEDYYSSLVTDFDNIIAIEKAKDLQFVAVEVVLDQLLGFGHVVDKQTIQRVIDVSAHDLAISDDRIVFSDLTDDGDETSFSSKEDPEAKEKVSKMALDAAKKEIK